MNIKSALAIAITIAFAGTVAAQTPPSDSAPGTPRVDKREARQAARIEQGKSTGSLTNQEAARLDKGQQHVAKIEGQAKADGKVTKQERARLAHAQNKQSKKIVRAKHNNRTAQAPATATAPANK